MKKILSLTLIALLVLSMFALTSCAGKNGDSAETSEAASETAEDADTTDDTASEAASETAEDAGNTADTASEETMGQKLVVLFKTETEAGSDLETIANKLAEAADLDCVVMPAQEGFLNGFTAEISGFSSGYGFSPMIGSIPFVGYVFETDDAEALKANLESLADPRWNICTEAAETVIEVADNIVFFAMCPGEDEIAE